MDILRHSLRRRYWIVVFCLAVLLLIGYITIAFRAGKGAAPKVENVSAARDGASDRFRGSTVSDLRSTFRGQPGIAQERPKHIPLDTTGWLNEVCPKPSREELRKLLLRSDLTRSVRLGAALLDSSLLFDALGDVELDGELLTAAIALGGSEVSSGQFLELLKELQPEDSTAYFLLASRFLEEGNWDGVIEILESAPAESGSGNAVHRQAIEDALIALGRDPIAARVYAAFGTPSRNGAVDVISKLFSITDGKVTRGIGLSREQQLQLLPRAIAVLQEISGNPNWSIMHRSSALATELALLDYSEAESLPVNLSGVSIENSREQIREESKRLEGALPALFNSESVYRAVSSAGIAEDYLSAIMARGEAGAFLWLREVHPNVADSIKPLVPVLPFRIQ